MVAKWLKDVPNWEKEYLKMAEKQLSKRQIDILNGDDLKSNEGMMYGSLYNDWKRRKDEQD